MTATCRNRLQYILNVVNNIIYYLLHHSDINYHVYHTFIEEICHKKSAHCDANANMTKYTRPYANTFVI